MRVFMYYMASKLGLRISEVEAWPVAELLEWARYERIKDKKPDQDPDKMLAFAKLMTARLTAQARSAKRG